jgi:hypothetical protein
MGFTFKDVGRASDEVVKEDLRAGHWLVYGHYCAVDPAEGVVKCTGGVDPELVQELNEKLVQRPALEVRNRDGEQIVYAPSPYAQGPYVAAPTFLKDPPDTSLRESDAQDTKTFWEYFNPVGSYSPLRYPDLFLEFAGLADGGEITLDTMLDWVGHYGVLGFEGREYRGIDPRMPDLMGGPYDSLLSFNHEARKANAVLRLYEAATALGGPDVEEIIRHEDYNIITPVIENRAGDRLEDPLFLKEIALDWVARTVRRAVADDCYPELYQEGDTFRNGYGFKSLLGAMYLQMMWLMSATGEVRRCQGPGCNKVIVFEQPEPPKDPGLKKNARGRYRTRKDKKFCSDNCRVKHHQHTRKIAERQPGRIQ